MGCRRAPESPGAVACGQHVPVPHGGERDNNEVQCLREGRGCRGHSNGIRGAGGHASHGGPGDIGQASRLRAGTSSKVISSSSELAAPSLKPKLSGRELAHTWMNPAQGAAWGHGACRRLWPQPQFPGEAERLAPPVPYGTPSALWHPQCPVAWPVSPRWHGGGPWGTCRDEHHVKDGKREVEDLLGDHSILVHGRGRSLHLEQALQP